MRRRKRGGWYGPGWKGFGTDAAGLEEAQSRLF